MTTPDANASVHVGKSDNGRPLRICCGPRCGADPEHRAVYRALEQSAPCAVEPTLCRALCGMGITVITPDGGKQKLRFGDVETFLSEIFASAKGTP